MSSTLEVRTVGRGRVSEAEKQAVKWLISQRVRDGAWNAFADAERAFVRRLTRKPYDLLIWSNKTPPGEAWALSRDSKNGIPLVEKCLKAFAAMGLVGAGEKISYETFCGVVARQQAVIARQRNSTNSAMESLSRAVEFAGSAYFESDSIAWPASIRRAARTQNGLVIQLQGHVDGNRYHAEANLALQDGCYLGTAVMTGLEQKWKANAQITLTETFADDNRWELSGDWIEKYEGSEQQAAYSFDLELERLAT